MTGDTSRQALRAPLTRAPRSMAQRLTLALTLLAVAVFVAVALLLHSGLQQEVERARITIWKGRSMSWSICWRKSASRRTCPR